MHTGGWINKLATPFIDILTLASFYFVLPFLVERFHAQDGWNLLLITGGYLLLCVGIFICKRLESRPVPTVSGRESKDKKTASQSSQGCSQALAWPYAIFVFVMLLDSSGVLLSGSSWGEKLQDLDVTKSLLVVLVFLVFLLLFPLLLLRPSRPSIKFGSSSHVWLRIFGVMAVNFMVLITAAYWEWQLAEAEPMEISLVGKILVFIIAYIVFLMFYSPHRLALLDLEPAKWAFTGYAVMLGYTVGRFIF